MHICLGLVVEYWPFVGAYRHNGYSKLYYLCLLSSLFKFLPPSTSPPCPSHPLIYAAPLLINSIKNWQNLVKISHYLLARLAIQKLIDNQVSLCSMNVSKYQSKTGFLNWIFKTVPCMEKCLWGKLPRFFTQLRMSSCKSSPFDHQCKSTEMLQCKFYC